MPDLPAIYRDQAQKYDLLVEREDYRHNLLPVLTRIAPVDGARVVELGAGTGRVTRLLVPLARSVEAFDASSAMLAVAEARLRQLGRDNWRLAVADHRAVPAPSGGADVSISGWSICSLAVFTGTEWTPEVRAALAEMERVVSTGGTVIIIETLGTGTEVPRPPDALRDYYDLLSADGFAMSWIRTDYLFRDREEALDLTRFFFGEEPVSALREESGGVVLPECTGIWWKTVA
jgi:ubiquinone/menaquinone biosynthesis C-methylase UbiE